MRDFTLKTYRNLLETLQQKNCTFITFEEYISNKGSMLNSQSSMDSTTKIVILRHDVDRKPLNSLITAKLENELGIKGSYYFRIVPESFDVEIIKKISSLGHEIGYHYEEIDFAWRQYKSQKLKNNSEGLVDLAYELFKKNLEKIRKVAEIRTICMHGSPLSPFDNKLMWDKYNYKELGIIGEPYFDIDWNEFDYLTDTGRRWDGYEVSVRDKVQNVKFSMFNVQLKSTKDIIENVDSLPDKIMINVHPERWNDNLIPWLNQFVLQNIKNVVKRFIVNE